MSITNRRVFLMQAAACGSVLVAARAEAQAAKLDEKDPQAVALGYVADPAKAATKTYPQHTTAQTCNNCALYQGKATDASGGCPLFGVKHVVAGGWCSAWAKKA